jgi:hypothetical protein
VIAERHVSGHVGLDRKLQCLLRQRRHREQLVLQRQELLLKINARHGPSRSIKLYRFYCDALPLCAARIPQRDICRGSFASAGETQILRLRLALKDAPNSAQDDTCSVVIL